MCVCNRGLMQMISQTWSVDFSLYIEKRSKMMYHGQIILPSFHPPTPPLYFLTHLLIAPYNIGCQVLFFASQGLE